MNRRRGEGAVWVSWLQWALATVVGATGGSLLGMGLPAFWHVSGILGGMVAGAVIGLMQGIVLRRRGYPAGWWILTSAVGWSAGLERMAHWYYQMGFTPLAGHGTLALSGAAGGLLGGLLVGLMQWFLLRRWFCRSGWWVLANAVAWSVGWTVAGLPFFFNPFLSGAVAGGVAGVITGGAMAWLLSHPRPAQQ